MRPPSQEAAATDLSVLAGMEITTLEECHVVGLFPDAERAGKVGAEVTATLPPADQEYTRFFGEQLVLGPIGEARGQETPRSRWPPASTSPPPSASSTRTTGSPSRRTSTARRSASSPSSASSRTRPGFDAVEVSRNVVARL